MGRKRFSRNLKKIQAAFQPDNLIDICDRDETSFQTFGEYVECGGPYEYRGVPQQDFYVYQDNGGDVLGVAHLDSVQDGAGAVIATTKTGSSVIFSPKLDDRLGAWVIVDLLPRIGVKTDWLLTVGEETASSTGMDFVRDHIGREGKDYNWMFQFDRMGTDVVLYQYDTPYLRKLLRSVGMIPDRGMFSDISQMDDLGCAGFNVGVGYQDYHGPRAHAWLDDTFGQVARFVDFYHRYHNRRIEFVPVKYTPRQTDAQITAGWDDKENWEKLRDNYLSQHPGDSKSLSKVTYVRSGSRVTAVSAFDSVRGYHDYQQECRCGHAEYIHKVAGGSCEYDGCTCVAFHDASAFGARDYDPGFDDEVFGETEEDANVQAALPMD